MPTFVTKIDQFVIDELKRRERLTVANKTRNEDLLWLNGRTPWVKMQSNAVFDKENPNVDFHYERSYILYSGWLNTNNNSKFGVAYSPSNQYRPFPSITNLDVTIKGHVGIMRETKVKFKAYTLNQLEILQSLYMTPGIGVLVEWGWSVPESTLSSIKLSEIPTPKEDNRWLKKTIQEKIATGKGMYDALFGLCSDFSITVTDDGSWDCETTIVGPGALTVDVNLQSHGSALGDKLSTFFDVLVAKELAGSSVTAAPGTGGRVAGTDAYKVPFRVAKVRGIQADASFATNDKQLDAKNDSAKSSPATLPQVQASNIYVTWEFIEVAFNTFFKTEASGNATGGVFINSFTDVPYIPCFRIQAIRPTMRSIKPDIMLIPGSPSDFNENALDSRNPRYFATFTRRVPTGGASTFGDFGAVWLNYNRVVKDMLKNKESVREAINEMLGLVNDASGGLWDLQLIFDDNYRNWRVVDFKSADGEAKSDTTYTFNLNRKDSIIREAQINMVIPNALKTTVMVASNAPTGNIYSSTADRDKVAVIRGLTRGVQDRFAKQMLLDTTKPSDSKRDETAKGTPFSHVVNLDKQPYWYTPTSDERDAYINFIFEQIESTSENSTFRSALIPLDLTITIDGVAGIKWGNAFSVSYLPERYIKNTLFQVKDITHSVSNDGWTTTLIGQMRPVYKSTPNMPKITPSNDGIQMDEVVVEGQRQ